MFKVGVTGGIGAGKSLVCKIFQTIGYPVYHADARAKSLINEDEVLKASIINLLGEEAYDYEGNYNRDWVGKQVFANKQLLDGLNDLVHPAVHQDADRWFAMQTSPFSLYEAALIIEGNTQESFDALICVSAPEELRIKRVIKRNGLGREAVVGRINSQSSDNEKRKHCHFEIINDEQHFLIPQVLKVNQILLDRINVSTKS